MPCDPNLSVQMSQAYSEASLYRQLAHYTRLLNPEMAVNKVKDAVKREDAEKELAPVRPALEAASACVSSLQGKSKYRWVSMTSVCA